LRANVMPKKTMMILIATITALVNLRARVIREWKWPRDHTSSVVHVWKLRVRRVPLRRQWKLRARRNHLKKMVETRSQGWSMNGN
jgi:hypothetical protein